MKQPEAKVKMHCNKSEAEQIKSWEGQVVCFKKKTYLLDIINIARRCHLSLTGILIKAALFILSIWILVDKTDYHV